MRSTPSGKLGFISLLPNVCQSLFTSAILSAVLPVLFIQTYQLYFWLVALVLTIASGYFFLKNETHIVHDKNLIIINAGFLLSGLSFSFLAQYADFFKFVGLIIVIIGLLLLFLPEKMNRWYRFLTTVDLDSFPIYLPKFTGKFFLFSLVVVAFLINQYILYQSGFFK